MEVYKLKKILEDRTEYKKQLSPNAIKIENFMFQKIIDLMMIKIENSKKVWYDGGKIIEEEERIKNEELVLNEIKEASENYNIPAMILYILSTSHDEFVKRNLINFSADFKNEEEKCIPFNLLSWEDAGKNLEILLPIIQALKIEYDEKDIKDEFEKQQIIYLINNNIFSKKDLIQRIKQGYKFYDVFYEAENIHSEDVNKLLEESYVAKKMTAKISKKLDWNLKNNLKKFISIDKDELGFVKITDLANKKTFWSHTNKVTQKIIGFRKQALPKINKPMLKSIYRLSRECGIIFPENMYKHEYYYYNMDSFKSDKALFVPYKEGTDEQKKQIEKRNKKFEKFKEKAENSDSKKYNKKGTVSIAIVDNSHNISVKYKDDVKNEHHPHSNKKIFHLEFTKKELAQIGVLPSEVGWVPSKTKVVTSKDIAEADKERKISLSIYKKASEYMDKLLNKENKKFYITNESKDVVKNRIKDKDENNQNKDRDDR